MDPFDFLEIVIFIYVSIMSADVYYVGFLLCVSSAAVLSFILPGSACP